MKFFKEEERKKRSSFSFLSRRNYRVNNIFIKQLQSYINNITRIFREDHGRFSMGKLSRPLFSAERRLKRLLSVFLSVLQLFMVKLKAERRDEKVIYRGRLLR
jgi:hypothetical protein